MSDETKRIGNVELQVNKQDVDIEFFENSEVTHVVFDIASPQRLSSRVLAHVMGILFNQACINVGLDPAKVLEKIAIEKRKKGMN